MFLQVGSFNEQLEPSDQLYVYVCSFLFAMLCHLSEDFLALFLSNINDFAGYYNLFISAAALLELPLTVIIWIRT